MNSQSQWSTAYISPDEQRARYFFTDVEWDTVEAATARIIPTDYDPGAREAGVIHFLDRFLSGTRFIYASATGDGFLEIRGKEAEAWARGMAHRQRTYREGVSQMNVLSVEGWGRPFVALLEADQDAVLVEMSGKPKPEHVTLYSESDINEGEGGPPPSNQPVNDEGMGFFDMLVFHTRQGFYADPVYGGNRKFIGWRVIGFEGPESLAATVNGTYTTTDYMLMRAEWPYAQSPAVQAFPLRKPKSGL